MDGQTAFNYILQTSASCFRANCQNSVEITANKAVNNKLGIKTLRVSRQRTLQTKVISFHKYYNLPGNTT